MVINKRGMSVYTAILAFILLAGCSARTTAGLGTPGPASTSLPSPTSTPSPALPTETQVPGPTTPPPTPTPQPRNTHYQISAQLDYATRQLSVSETVAIQNPASQELTTLSLVVPPNWWPGVFQLEALSWQGGEKIIEYSLEGVRLKIPIREAWFPGEIRELSLTYTLSLPEMNVIADVGPNPFGYSLTKDSLVKQINLVDWYPFLPPYQEGSGWIIHEPWIFGEYLVYPSADFDVSLQILNGPEDLVVAASALDSGEKGTYRYHLEGARNFVFSISPYYQILEEEVKGTKVLGYHFPFYEQGGEAAFQATIKALQLYSDLYHPYEQPSLTMVQADFDHGMEYEGLYFLNRSFFNSYTGSPASFLIAIAAHETTHQWWYGLVANDQALEPWLDEALCTYNEKVFFENYHPEAVEWWWVNRVDYHQPQGVIDRSIYDYKFPEFTNPYYDYRDAIYLQGAHFLEDLRDLVGDEVFFSFLADYAGTYAGEIATGEDFFCLLEEHTDADLQDLLSTYFQSKP